MALMDILMKRRSVRSYTGEPVSRKDLEKILTAGLIGPTGKGKKPWRFVVVTDPEKLEELSGMRKPAPAAFKTAGAAIAVFGDPGVSDTWVEDCSIAMENMHVMADDLGLGSVWIQSRLREATTAVLRAITHARCSASRTAMSSRRCCWWARSTAISPITPRLMSIGRL